MIDNEQDFKKYVLSMGSKLSVQSPLAEINNEKHTVGAHACIYLEQL